MKPTVFLAAAAVILLAAASAPAAQTFLKRETFQGVGVLDGTTRGNFSSVTGTFTKVPVGPRASGVDAPGWSADLRLSGSVNYRATFDMGSAPASLAGNCGMFGAWFRFKQLPESQMGIMQLLDDAGGSPKSIASLYLNGNGTLNTENEYTGSAADKFTSTQTLAPNTWYFLVVAWQSVDGAHYNLRCGLMPLGGTMAIWASGDNLICQGTPFSAVNVGGMIGGGAGYARVGCPSLYALGSLADLAYPADLIAPVDQPTNWYVNPATGNDANDGLTPATAWRTVVKLDTESRWMGLLDNSVVPGPGGGDIVNIDTSAAPLPLGTATLKMQTQGVTVQPAAGQPAINLLAEKILPPSAWSATGTANVYSTGDAEANVVLWENDRWLNHPFGANFSSVASALSSTPGSFYVDPTTTPPTLYVHPFGDTDPRQDGKSYTRSQFRTQDGTTGSAAVEMATSRYLLKGITVQKTSIVDAVAHDAIGAYCIQHSGSSTGGTSMVSSCQLRYGSKHLFGSTDGSTNSSLLIQDVSAEQGSPYTDLGGQCPFVSYNGAPNGHNVHVYRRCSCVRTSGAVGSTAGASSLQPAFLSHSDTNADFPFDLIELDSCNFPNDLVDPNGASKVLVTGSTVGSFSSGCPNNVIEQCHLTGDGPGVQTAASLHPSLLVRNCVMNPVRNLAVAPFYGFQLMGTVTIENCTFDLRNILGSAGSFPALLWRTAALSLTCRNNVFIAPASGDWAVLCNGTAADTFTFDHNAYQLGGTTLVRAYTAGGAATDLTFAQWQAAGRDAASFKTADAMVDESYMPLSGSPLLDAGVNIGPAPDYTGVAFPVRDDIGALECTTPATTYAAFTQKFFSAGEQNDASVSGPLADPDGDGVTNFAEYAFNLNPRRSDPAAQGTGGVSNGYLTLTYQQSKLATDVVYTVEVSGDLRAWQSGDAYTTRLSAADVDANTQRVVVRDNVPLTLAGRRFMRVRVTLR